MKAWRECLGQVETRKCFIYISAKSGNSFVLIGKLVNVKAFLSRSQNFLFDFMLLSIPSNANEKCLSTFDNPFRKTLFRLSPVSAFIAQFDFKWEIDFSSYIRFLPLLKNMALKAKKPAFFCCCFRFVEIRFKRTLISSQEKNMKSSGEREAHINNSSSESTRNHRKRKLN